MRVEPRLYRDYVFVIYSDCYNDQPCVGNSGI